MSRTYKSKSGMLCVDFNGEQYNLGLGGSYISPRIILANQKSPVENNNWDIYPSYHILVNCDAEIKNEVITIHSSEGDFDFVKHPTRFWYIPDATNLTFQKTKTQFAEFLDFEKRFKSELDTTRIIY